MLLKIVRGLKKQKSILPRTLSNSVRLRSSKLRHEFHGSRVANTLVRVARGVVGQHQLVRVSLSLHTIHQQPGPLLEELFISGVGRPYIRYIIARTKGDRQQHIHSTA